MEGGRDDRRTKNNQPIRVPRWHQLLISSRIMQWSSKKKKLNEQLPDFWKTNHYSVSRMLINFSFFIWKFRFIYGLA